MKTKIGRVSLKDMRLKKELTSQNVAVPVTSYVTVRAIQIQQKAVAKRALALRNTLSKLL